MRLNQLNQRNAVATCASHARRIWSGVCAYPDASRLKTMWHMASYSLWLWSFLRIFAERLIITMGTIKNQILGFVGVFMVIWTILWLSIRLFSFPILRILLAFVIIALAVLVMSIISGRFNEQMKAILKWPLYTIWTSRSSASVTAFQLAFMKRRKTRTILTFLTLLLLTFTVLSFTSISTECVLIRSSDMSGLRGDTPEQARNLWRIQSSNMRQ